MTLGYSPISYPRRQAGMAALVAAVAVAVGSTAAWAQAGVYPTKPITFIVPQAAGGTNDIVGRLVVQKLGEVLGGSAVVENRPGAGGNIGTQYVARAPKDGYTLLMTISSSQAINPALYRNPGFDPVKDFRPVSLVGAVPNVLLVYPNFAARTLPEMLAMAKAKPGDLQYASAGNGTLNHLLGEMLGSMAGVQLAHVPYKGVAPALNDVLGGQLPMLFASLPSALPHIKSGKLRALAVSSPTRSPVAPDVPTIAETVPGYSGMLWVGVFSPAGTPDEAQRRLVDGMAKALADRGLRDKLELNGLEMAAPADKPVTPEQFAKVLQDDIVKWAGIVKRSGATVD